ncbi:MAG: peptidylprolyl isomerase [Oscillospiraceae bacterium]
MAATYSDETDRDQHPSGYTFTVGDGTLPAACEEAAQALEEGQFSGVVEADDGFYLILRKHRGPGGPWPRTTSTPCSRLRRTARTSPPPAPMRTWM